VDNIAVVSNPISRMIALFYATAKEKEDERSFNEKRMFG
jgi:hypothetical protein